MRCLYLIVYANLLGKWTELGDNDYIENETSEIYVNYHLSKQEISSLNKFLSVVHNNQVFHVHISQIQWISSL